MSIEPPSNFNFDSQNRTLNWDGVLGATNYEILFKADNPISTWAIAYTDGVDTECTFEQPTGYYKAKGRTSGEGGWGLYGPEETVIVT